MPSLINVNKKIVLKTRPKQKTSTPAVLNNIEISTAIQHNLPNETLTSSELLDDSD
jgi:hypothetical protein